MKSVTGYHANIVEFFEYFEEWNHLDLVFEFCSCGTIDSAIKSRNLDHSDAACYCYQLLSALAFLKERNVLHRDIKPANILLKDEQTCKLADFGSACFLNYSEHLFYRGGTPAF